MSGRQEPALSPAYAHVTTPSDLWERTGRVTLCGPTGQLHALAILESFALDFEAAELPPEVRAQFGPACLLFHGLCALAAFKTAAAAHFSDEPPASTLRESLWYLLELRSDEAPIEALYYGVPADFGADFLDAADRRTRSWAARQGQVWSTTDREWAIRLPRLVPQDRRLDPSILDWCAPWINHYVKVLSKPIRPTETPDFHAAVRLHVSLPPMTGSHVLSCVTDELDPAMPHAEAVPVSVCSLAHNFLYAVMHLSTCVGRQGSFRARDLLHIMLVRDLVETYGHHHAAFRLDKLATLAALVYDYRQLVRTQSRLARALDDENTITAWCGVFVDEYCGGPATTELGGAGSQARFRVPAARTPGFRDSLKRECLETLAWLRRRLFLLTADRVVDRFQARERDRTPTRSR
ncbi:hypothetical protein BMF94_3102 [Rhodotorula taiwanensis]|uniref:Uncharacterized protein n=1 Tax=Rhodotorula taiwanensis TaxID=741276 RepID=A0A2S5BAQ0_9BASI|nr:hypothetical protein BMF94_3102 [Rhodotorula taiwanensis]